MDYLKKVKILTNHFSLYGIGNFDLTLEEMAKILEIIDKENPTKELNSFYDELSKQRLG